MAETIYGITDTGRARDNNEDSFIAESWKKDLFAACVIDGVGGYEGGEVAAAIARETFIRELKKELPDVLQAMRLAMLEANRNIFREKAADSANSRMSCVATMVLADTKQNRFYYTHVGDTRLYLFRDGSLTKISEDQSFVGYLEDSGRISELEAMRHPKRNEINKALGFEQQPEAQEQYFDSGESPFLPGDLLLLCSDGLTDMVSRTAITEILTEEESLQQAAARLVDAANHAGGKDNITIVLVRHPARPKKQKVIAPAIKKDKKELSTGEEKPAAKSPAGRKRNRTFSILLLILIALISTATSIYLFREHFVKQENTDTLVVRPEKNASEIALQDSLQHTGTDSFLVHHAVFGDTIRLTDSLLIDRDSFYLSGPVVLVRDSSFTSGGPAIVVSQRAKHVVLDHIVFHGFSLAILAHDPEAIKLGEVSFKNTRLAVAFALGEGAGQLEHHSQFTDSSKRNRR